MSKTQIELLSLNQRKSLEKLGEFNKLGVLGGGTAIVLQLYHRRSYDLDFFLSKPLPNTLLHNLNKKFNQKIQVVSDSSDELSIITPFKIKLTFLYFPFPNLHPLVEIFKIKIFDLRDLASNKVYAIGRRGEYRDYIDLLFLLKHGCRLNQIIEETKKRFTGIFSEKLFLEQLIYFEDIKDFTVEFIGRAYSPKDVKSFFEKETGRYLSQTLT